MDIQGQGNEGTVKLADQHQTEVAVADKNELAKNPTKKSWLKVLLLTCGALLIFWVVIVGITTAISMYHDSKNVSAKEKEQMLTYLKNKYHEGFVVKSEGISYGDSYSKNSEALWVAPSDKPTDDFVVSMGVNTAPEDNFTSLQNVEKLTNIYQNSVKVVFGNNALFYASDTKTEGMHGYFSSDGNVIDLVISFNGDKLGDSFYAESVKPQLDKLDAQIEADGLTKPAGYRVNITNDSSIPLWKAVITEYGLSEGSPHTDTYGFLKTAGLPRYFGAGSPVIGAPTPPDAIERISVVSWGNISK